jgi:hypothetical protein
MQITYSWLLSFHVRLQDSNIPTVSTQHSISQPIKTPLLLLQSSFAAPYLLPSLPYPDSEPGNKHLTFIHPPSSILQKHPRPTKILQGSPIRQFLQPLSSQTRTSVSLLLNPHPTPSPLLKNSTNFSLPIPSISHYHDSSRKEARHLLPTRPGKFPPSTSTFPDSAQAKPLGHGACLGWRNLPSFHPAPSN